MRRSDILTELEQNYEKFRLARGLKTDDDTERWEEEQEERKKNWNTKNKKKTEIQKKEKLASQP